VPSNIQNFGELDVLQLYKPVQVKPTELENMAGQAITSRTLLRI
jgi:hypothetical protein